MMPRHIQSLAEAGTLAEDTPEYRQAFVDAARRYGDEWPRSYEMFGQALGVLVDAAWEGDWPTYDDVVGQVFERLELHNPNAGQFFTPEAVSTMIGQMEGIDREVYRRLRESFSTLPEFILAEMMGHEISDETLGAVLEAYGRPEDFEPVTVYDPACGSCRMLLAVAKTLPRWMIDHGLVHFYGQDIDRKCALMGRINSMLYLQPRVRMGYEPPAETAVISEANSLTTGQLALTF